MQADIHHLMDDDIFYFIDKALRDAYYQLQDPMASYELGCLYYYERYNHVNYKKAFKYFSKEVTFNKTGYRHHYCRLD